MRLKHVVLAAVATLLIGVSSVAAFASREDFPYKMRGALFCDRSNITEQAASKAEFVRIKLNSHGRQVAVWRCQPKETP